MNLLDIQLKKIKQEQRIGLMTHAVVGYPNITEMEKIVYAMAEGGADIIELQIPFSDPLADGPTIMQACEQSLIQGTKVADAFTTVKAISKHIKIPLLFMCYYNTVFRYGVENFCYDAVKSGVSGIIVPDMNLDEEAHEHLSKHCKKYNLHNIHVVAPASSIERLKLNGRRTSGFIYCTAQQGITGVKKTLPPYLSNYLKTVKKYIDSPLAVGFGISKPEHIQKLKKHADIAVVGSAIINVINNSKRKNIDVNEEIKKFMKELTFSERRVY